MVKRSLRIIVVFLGVQLLVVGFLFACLPYDINDNIIVLDATSRQQQQRQLPMVPPPPSYPKNQRRTIPASKRPRSPKQRARPPAVSNLTTTPNQNQTNVTNATTATTTPTTTVHVWMHIPKTAGTAGYDTFLKAIHLQQRRKRPELREAVFPPISSNDWNSPGCNPAIDYGASHCAPSELRHCFETRTEAVFARMQIPFSQQKQQQQHLLQFYTILRDPVERVLSEYFWWRKNPHVAAWTASMRAHRQDLEAWVRDDTNVAHNRQATFVLMNRPFPDQQQDECIHMMGNKLYDWIVSEYGSVAQLNNHHALQMDEYYTNGTTTAAASPVLLLLQDFRFVAVLEELALSQAAFERVTGVAALLPAPKKKKQSSQLHRAKKLPVSDHIRALIRERNQLDLHLHQYALQRLHEIVEG